MTVDERIQTKSDVAARVRTLDWSRTALGPIDTWSDALLNSVNLILAAPIAMQLFWGPDFTCIYNDAMAPALSAKHPASLGQPARDVWREAWPTIGPQVEHVFREGEAVSFGNALVPLLQEGVLQDRYWTYSYSPIFDAAGAIVGVLDVAQDTTDVILSERVEQARKVSEQQLADFTLATNDALFQLSADGSTLSELTGRRSSPDALTAQPDWLERHVDPRDRPRVADQVAQAVRTGSQIELEYRTQREDGRVGWVFLRATPSVNAQGQVTHWFGAARDITDRKRAEEETRDGRLQLLLALEAASLASWFYDPVRKVVGGDALMGKLFGLSVLEGPAEMWLAAIVPEDRERVSYEFGTGIAGMPYDTEYRVCVDGQVRWLRARAKLVHSAVAPSRMLGICEDITEWKTSEQTLYETLQRLALAQQVGNIAAWEWDLVTGEFTWDTAGAWVYGRSPSELRRLERIQPFIHKDDLAQVMEDLNPALTGQGEFNSEFRVCWPDGSHHWLIGKGRSVINEHGQVIRINGVYIDITDRRTAEMALRQSEKLAAVGQLASTISHEINNPLEAVTNLLFLAKREVRDPNAAQYLSMAEVELRRVSAITSQTLRFHKQLTRQTEVSCVDLFSNALMIFEGRIENAGIRVEKRKRAERPVSCFEGEIRQVMNNLVGNAVDAMKQGGTLLVRSAESTDWRTGRKGLRLTVADTGTGMSQRVLGQIFQPFYTTKGISGTGLGLWVSQEIVQRHKGRLTVRTSDRPGASGTVFNLFLPYRELESGVMHLES